jgi:hypothetical protein
VARPGGCANGAKGWSSALFYYGDDALNQYRYERVDLRVAKRFRIQGSTLELAALWQQRLDDQPTTVEQNRMTAATA